ncbi:hypothetical protein ACUY3P_04665 [Corynebacterium lehmanniae]
MINSNSRVKLAQGAHPFLRADNVMQFGTDATRTGLVTTDNAKDVAALLGVLMRPRRLGWVLEQLAELIDAEAARSLVDDLVSYRVLVPAVKPEVLLVGHGRLATAVTARLRECGLDVRTQARNEALSKFLLRGDTWVPVAAVNTTALLGELAALTRQRQGAVLPVTQVDARVVVGPVCARPGPCPLCVRLYLLDRDPNWPVVEQRAPLSVQGEPIAAAAGAAFAAVSLRRLAGVLDPPGVSAPKPNAGLLTVVDPFAPHPVSTATLPPHPDCAMCF